MPSIAQLRAELGSFADGKNDEQLLQLASEATGQSPGQIAGMFGYNPTTSGPTAKRFGASADQYQAGLYGLGEAVTGADFFKRNRIANEFSANVAMERAANQGAVNSWEQVHGVGDLPSYVGGLAIQSAPYVGEALVGGLAARGLMSGTRAAATAARAAGDRAALTAATGRLATGQIAGATAASYPSSVADILQNQREQAGTTDLTSAALYGVPYAALNALGETGVFAGRGVARGGMAALDSLQGFKGGLARAGYNAGRIGLEEAVGETGQEMLNQGGRMAVDPNAQFLSPEALARYKESAIGGFALGGLTGGAAGGWRRTQEGGVDLTQRDSNAPQQYGLITEPVPLQQRIDQQLGIGLRTTPKDYAKQFEAAYNEPSGQYANDPVTGLEKQLSVGEYLQSTSPPLDLTASASVSAGATPGVTTPVPTRDSRGIELRDVFGVIPTPHSMQLYDQIKQSGLPLDADILAPVWAYAADKPMSGKRLEKAQQLLDAAIIAAQKGTANVSTPTTSTAGTSASVGTGAPVIQGNLAPTGSIAPLVGTVGGNASGTNAPNAQAAISTTPPGQSATPLVTTTGTPSGNQTAQTIQTETQGQQAPATSGTATATAAPVTKTVNGKKVRVVPSGTLGAAVSNNGLIVPDSGVQTELAPEKAAQVKQDAAAARSLLVRAFGERDTAILHDALVENLPHAEVATKHGISRGRVVQIVSPANVKEKLAVVGGTEDQLRTLLGALSTQTRAASLANDQIAQAGNQAVVDQDLEGAGLAIVNSQGGSQGNVLDRTEKGVKLKTKEVAAKLEGLREQLALAEKSDDLDTAEKVQKEINTLEAEYVSPEERIAGKTQMVYEQAQAADELEAKITEAEQAGQTTVALKNAKVSLDEARGMVEELRIKVNAELDKTAALLNALKAAPSEVKPEVVAAQATAAEARKRWNDAGRDLTKLDTSDLQVLRTYTQSIKNLELSGKIAAELQSRGKTVGATNAVSKPSATSVPVQEQPKGGGEVRQGNTQGGQTTTARKTKAASAETQVKSSEEQWNDLAKTFPQMPAYETLSADEKTRWADVAQRGVANLAAANTILSAAAKAAPAENVAAPAATGTAEAVSQINGTDEQKKTAKTLADSKGGSVVWQEGDLALIRGYSVLTGQPVYAGAIAGSITKVDIESFTGTGISPEQKTKLTQVKKQLESQDAEKHAADPFIKFDSAGVAVSQGVSPNLTGVVSGWKQMLGIKANVYVTTIEDAKADKDKLTGPQRAVGSAGLDANEAGSMRKLADGSYYIAFTKGTSVAKMLETIGHELGHVHEKEAFANASLEDQKAIKAEFEKWKASTKGKSAQAVVESLRARATGRSTKGFEGKTAEDMTAYWKSFSEWYADQVSRWATTSEKPLTVVEKFFSKLGKALKQFYYSLKGQKYLPNDTMKQFLDKIANGELIIDDKSARALDNDLTSQAMFVGLKGVQQAGMSDKQTSRFVLAKLMDANGELRSDIWYDTNWTRGADKKWRTEISDKGAKFTFEKIMSGGNVRMDTLYKLGDILDHPKLFKLYPELANYKIEYDADVAPRNAAFIPSKKQILMSGQYVDDMPTLLHEIQHAIQELEGFGRGANPADMDVLNASIASKWAASADLFNTPPEAKEAMVKYRDAVKAKEQAVRDRDNAIQPLPSGAPALLTDAKRTALDRVFTTDREAKAALKAMLNALNITRETFQTQLYQMVSGEIEARDVEARRQYDESLRRQIVPGESQGFPVDVQLVSDSRFSNSYFKFGVNAPPTPSFVQQAIAALPKVLQQPVRNSVGVIKDVTGKYLDYAVFTGDLVNRAVAAGLPSAKDFVQTIALSKAKAREAEQAVEKIADMYALVPDKDRGTGPASVNQFLFDSTRESKWGYGKYRNDVMGPRFDKLSKEAQNFVKAVFDHGATVLAQKKKVVLDSAVTEYDAMIKAAQDANDLPAKAKLESEKAATLKRFQTLFKVREGLPYAPIKRTGDHAVVAKSAEYIQAELSNNTKRIKELESDPDHYHVSFTDGKWDARTLQSQLQDQGFFQDVQILERDDAVNSLYGGASALRELASMRSRVEAAAAAGDKSSSKLLGVISQMYLEALAENSARKSEMRRRGVAGEVDMVQSFAQQGRADAQFMASVQYNPQVQASLQKMRNDAKTGNRERKSELFNELSRRYIQSMDYHQNPWLSKLTRASSLYFLATSPAYYLQNLTQPWIMTVPSMAGRHGYTEASGALFKAYTELGDVMKGSKLLKQQFDFSKVPADVRDAIKELVNRGKIDIGLDSEIGEFRVEGEGYVREKLNSVDKAMRLAVQKVESINRLSSAIAAYRLELAKTNDKTKALDYADQVLTDTHGDYTAFNAPRAFNNPVGKVMLQFRKFQLIQLAFHAKLIKDALQGRERAAALKALTYSLGHTAALAGVMGLPGYAAIAWAISKVLSGDDDKYDVEEEIRKAIGDEGTSNLVLRGAPTVAGMDISGKVGAGNMLSVLPFNNADVTTKAGLAQTFGTLVGGASLGMVANQVDGLGLMMAGDWYKGLERMMPKGVGDAMKAYRISNEGMTRRNGDVVLPPEEVTGVGTLLQAIGISPIEQTRVYERQQVIRDQEQAFKNRAQRITQDYVRAMREGDSEDASKAREAWMKLQQVRVEKGYTRQPLSTLLKAPQAQRQREKDTAGGVQFTKANKRAVMEEAEL